MIVKVKNFTAKNFEKRNMFVSNFYKTFDNVDVNKQ